MRSFPSGTVVLFNVKAILAEPVGTCSLAAVPDSRILTGCVGIGCSCVSALMLSVKLGPQLSSSVSYLHAGHCFDPAAATSGLCPLSEDERFLRCIFRSMRLFDDSLGLRLDDGQHTFNPRPFFLNSLVRRIECVLDRFNSDLNGSLVGLRQLLNHEFESVKTFPIDEHSCCIRKRFIVPLRACFRQDVLHLVAISVRTTLSLTDVCFAQAS